MPHILVVDDDKHIREMLEEVLVREGYHVSTAKTGAEALIQLTKDKPELVLLDLMLPDLDGEEIIKYIKDIPVIAVSAKIAVSSKVDVLLSGASDYITKPFEIDELLARVQVQLRKSMSGSEGSNIIFKDLELLSETLTVKVSGNAVRLTRTECAILKLLMLNGGEPVGRSTILDKISDETPDCTERSLKQHISNIRKKLQAVNGTDYIEAIYGIGFRMKS